uniref:Uncharacterized protein n=1 Tax=Mycena chlorophos TaxID=658473 RepID=A0ABQ0LN86_MYCCL|nr:predicted protein [Mycena chlorophos]
MARTGFAAIPSHPILLPICFHTSHASTHASMAEWTTVLMPAVPATNPGCPSRILPTATLACGVDGVGRRIMHACLALARSLRLSDVDDWYRWCWLGRGRVRASVTDAHCRRGRDGFKDGRDAGAEGGADAHGDGAARRDWGVPCRNIVSSPPSCSRRLAVSAVLRLHLRLLRVVPAAACVPYPAFFVRDPASSRSHVDGAAWTPWASKAAAVFACAALLEARPIRGHGDSSAPSIRSGLRCRTGMDKASRLATSSPLAPLLPHIPMNADFRYRPRDHARCEGETTVTAAIHPPAHPLLRQPFRPHPRHMPSTPPSTGAADTCYDASPSNRQQRTTQTSGLGLIKDGRVQPRKRREMPMGIGCGTLSSVSWPHNLSAPPRVLVLAFPLPLGEYLGRGWVFV